MTTYPANPPQAQPQPFTILLKGLQAPFLLLKGKHYGFSLFSPPWRTYRRS